MKFEWLGNRCSGNPLYNKRIAVGLVMLIFEIKFFQFIPKR